MVRENSHNHISKREHKEVRKSFVVKERGLSMWPDVRDGKTVRRKKRL